jgi:methylenetetrahydrofolate reductase (NADPH)
MRLIRLQKKIEAGAHFIQTQPVFDLEGFSRWMERAVEMGLHERTAILAGVMPVRSVRTLEWMKQRVPGMKIDDRYIESLSRARDPLEDGIRMAVEMMQAVSKIRGVRGIHLMPAMWESVIPTLVKEAGFVTTS